jgi:hypothetical protein
VGGTPARMAGIRGAITLLLFGQPAANKPVVTRVQKKAPCESAELGTQSRVRTGAPDRKYILLGKKFLLTEALEKTFWSPQKPGTDHTNDLVRQIAAEEAFSKKKKLGPQQILALKFIRNFPGKGKKRVVLQDLTGFGKTLIAATITEGALTKGIGCFLRFRPSL